MDATFNYKGDLFVELVLKFAANNMIFSLPVVVNNVNLRADV